MIVRFGSPLSVGRVHRRLIWNEFNAVQLVSFRVLRESDFDKWVALRKKLGLCHVESSPQLLDCRFYEVEILD